MGFLFLIFFSVLTYFSSDLKKAKLFAKNCLYSLHSTFFSDYLVHISFISLFLLFTLSSKIIAHSLCFRPPYILPCFIWTVFLSIFKGCSLTLTDSSSKLTDILFFLSLSYYYFIPIYLLPHYYFPPLIRKEICFD